MDPVGAESVSCGAMCRTSRPDWGTRLRSNSSSDVVLLLRKRRASGLAALLRNAREQSADLGLAVSAVSVERAIRRELASLGPARDRLGVDAEHRGNLSRGQQRLGIRGASGHE